jgi:hypothetical protein
MPTTGGLGEATVSIKIDIPQLKKDLAKAEKEVKTASRKLNKAMALSGDGPGPTKAGAKAGTNFSAGFKRSLTNFVSAGGKGGIGSVGAEIGASLMGGMSLAVTAGAAAVVAAIIGVAVAAMKSLQAFVRTEKILMRLEAAFRSTGMAAGKTARQMREFAADVSKTSLAPENEILEAAALISTFQNIVGENFEKAIKVSNDMAIAMGTNTKSAALQLSKALAQPLTGLQSLREIGILFTDEQKDMIVAMNRAGETAAAQNAVFEILAENGIDGNSEATDTLSGKWTQLVNASEGLLSAVGELIAAEGSLIDMITEVVVNLQNLAEATRYVAAQYKIVTDTQNALEDAFASGNLSIERFQNILKKASNEQIKLERERDKGVTEQVNRDAQLIQSTKDRTNAQLGMVKKVQDQIKAKEESIQKARFRRGEIEKLEQQNRVRFGLDQLEQAIAKEDKIQQDAVKKNKKLQDESRKKEKAQIKALDEQKRKVEQLIKLERKRELAKQSVSISGAEDVQTSGIEDTISAFNKRQEDEKKARLENLEKIKEGIEARKRAVKEQAEAERERANLELENIKEQSELREQLLKKRMEVQKDAFKKAMQIALEELDLTILQTKLTETFKEAIKVISKEHMQLRELARRDVQPFMTDAEVRNIEEGARTQKNVGDRTEELGKQIREVERETGFGTRMRQEGNRNMIPVEMRNEREEEARKQQLKEQRENNTLQNKTINVLKRILMKGGGGVFSL